MELNGEEGECVVADALYGAIIDVFEPYGPVFLGKGLRVDRKAMVLGRDIATFGVEVHARLIL